MFIGPSSTDVESTGTDTASPLPQAFVCDVAWLFSLFFVANALSVASAVAPMSITAIAATITKYLEFMFLLTLTLVEFIYVKQIQTLP
jgi:hypothetical protein